MKLLTRRSLPAIALPLLAVLFFAAVALSSVALRGLRIDLTESRLYTLSDGTQRILDKIDETIALKLYYSEQASRELPQFRLYAQRVRELLEEMVARSGGKLSLSVIDPEPFSEAEDEAAAHGLQAVPLGAPGQTLYFGLVGSNSTDGESAMPFIQPDKEAFLEYDVAKLISTLSLDQRPVLAVLSGLPTGPGFDPMAGRPHRGWVFDGQLAEFFELRRLQANPDSIAEDVDLLMLIHPKALPVETEYAIEQFVMRGGRLLVFVDPEAEAEPAPAMMDPTQLESTRSSNLPTLFAHWGLEFAPDKVVLDGRHALQVQPDPNAPPVRHLAVLGLGRDALNQNDVVSAELDLLHFASAGALSLREGATLKLEPLVQSSGSSVLVDAERVRLLSDPSLLQDDFQPGNSAYVLAARLTGKLTSAFPDRAGDGHLAESLSDANIVVVADTDVLSDRLWVQVQDFLGRPSYNVFANNGDFVYNAVDNLVGNADLIAVRTRAASRRPFERVEQLRRGAEQRYRSKADELQQQLDVLEQRLAQLQPDGDAGQAQALTAAQQAELLRFQDDKLRIRKELREVQRQLNAEIEALGAQLKLINILGIPLLLLLIALVVAINRGLRRRHAQG
ncbi:MAG TPA: Gldg family protein [Arenimonas sp.]|nr:Gldg family protein [Arenimonas sp.]